MQYSWIFEIVAALVTHQECNPPELHLRPLYLLNALHQHRHTLVSYLQLLSHKIMPHTHSVSAAQAFCFVVS